MRTEKRLNLCGSVDGFWWLRIGGTTHAVLAVLEAHICVHVAVSQDNNHRSWSRGSRLLPAPQRDDGEA